MTAYLVCLGYLLPSAVERINAATLAGYTPKVAGNDGHVIVTNGSGSFNAGYGSANPASGQNGDRFYRTDLGLEIMYWSGSWYTVETFQISTPWVNAYAANAQITPEILYSDYAISYMKSVVQFRVNTTNNASNYWTIASRSDNLAHSAQNNYHTFNTSTYTAGTIYSVETHTAMPGTAQTVASSARHEWYITKTGSPGTMDFGAAIWFKYLIT